MNLYAAVPAIVLSASTLIAMPPIFTKKSFEEAKKQATAEGKLLVVDSMAEWCGPCKQMDKTTWVDQKVVDWFKDNAIAFQFDVDADTKLAKDLSIEAMPTMIVFKDGKEIDRSVGYLNSSQLISWLEDVKKGKTKAEALKEEARKIREKAGDRAGPDGKVNVQARMDLARKLSRSEPALAAEEYAWLWDNMLDHQRSMYGVRLSFMVSDMQRLADKDDDAKKVFVKLRDAAEEKLKNKTATSETLTDWIALNKVVGDDDRTLAWYERVKADPLAASDIKRNERDLTRIFQEKERWADLGKMYKNPEVAARGEIKQAQMMLSMRGGGGDDAAEMKKFVEESTREKLATMYAALLAAGRDSEADAVAKTLLEFSDTPEARRALVNMAVEAKQPRQSQMKWLDEAGAKSKDEGDAELREAVKKGK